MSQAIDKAAIFAKQSHAAINQLRKYTNEPYIVHPAEVAVLVETVPHTAEMVQAAWLHDVVEDVGVEIAEIENQFGSEVAKLVLELTDVSKPSDGNRAARKAIDLQHTAGISKEAKTIKLADLISNTKSIVEYDHDFARVYLKEKQALLEVLKDGNPSLLATAHKLLIDGFEKISVLDNCKKRTNLKVIPIVDAKSMIPYGKNCYKQMEIIENGSKFPQFAYINICPFRISKTKQSNSHLSHPGEYCSFLRRDMNSQSNHFVDFAKKCGVRDEMEGLC